jgi:hypothetical protein
MVGTGSYKIIKLMFTKFSNAVIHRELCLFKFLFNYRRELTHSEKYCSELRIPTLSQQCMDYQ